MKISQGGAADIADVARLLWLMADDDERARGSEEEFTTDLSRWWTAHQESHIVFIARLDDGEMAGVAWVALVPRVPRPGSMQRMSADIQSVFVAPQHRGRGIGSELVDAAIEHAWRSGAMRVTVHSSSRAIPMYERLGFESSRHLLQRSPD